MLQLYNSLYSTCSQKVRMALHEKGLPFEDRQVDLARFEQLSPDYLKLNPTGVVPTLVHDGHPVIESSVIIEYLDEVFPETPLTPATALGRAEMRAWMRYFEEVPTQAVRVPTFNKYMAPRVASMTEEEFSALTEKMPVRKEFYRRMDAAKGAGFDERTTAESLERLAQTIRRTQAQLERPGNAWICGPALSLADITLMPTVVRMADLGLASMWDEAPNVAHWLEALKARPAFALTYPEGARLSTGLKNSE